MIKISVALKKTAKGIEILYLGEDAGKAIEAYREADGQCFLFDRLRPDRMKKTEDSKPKPKKAKVEFSVE